MEGIDFINKNENLITVINMQKVILPKIGITFPHNVVLGQLYCFEMYSLFLSHYLIKTFRQVNM